MKINLSNFLNKRHSTRNLSDEEFQNVVGELAKQLEQTSFYTKYSDKKLKEDWLNLCEWKHENDYINSTSRIGMKLCEHYFPNFYDIENNKGQSFSKMWTAKNLEKILIWNRKSHSTPYLSEIKRGVYFCCGLTKSTMYRPQMARLLCLNYVPSLVLDPCAGWGGRMLGVVSTGANYIAFEPNTETFNHLNELSIFLGIQNKVKIICDSALEMKKYNLPKVDMVLTSPPYFDVEIYTKEDTQSISDTPTYQSWIDNFLCPLVEISNSYLSENGISCWNVGKVGKKNMLDDIIFSHEKIGKKLYKSFSVISSKRQALQNVMRNEKSSDTTDVFK